MRFKTSFTLARYLLFYFFVHNTADSLTSQIFIINYTITLFISLHFSTYLQKVTLLTRLQNSNIQKVWLGSQSKVMLSKFKRTRALPMGTIS